MQRISWVRWELKLRHDGLVEISGQKYEVISSWEEDKLPVIQWWVDRESHLLWQMVVNDGKGIKKISRFHYDKINKALPFEDFFPVSSTYWDYKHFIKIRGMVDPLEEGYESRFIKINDGASGNLSVQWGQYGSLGRKDIGLK